MRVVLATGYSKLDEYLKQVEDIEVVGEAVYAEQIVNMAKENLADVVLYSETLPVSKFEGGRTVGAEANIVKIIENLVDENIRTVMLLNQRPAGHQFLESLINLGVYDLIMGERITVDEIISTILKPRTRKQVKHLLIEKENGPSDDIYRAKEIVIQTEEEEKKSEEPRTPLSQRFKMPVMSGIIKNHTKEVQLQKAKKDNYEHKAEVIVFYSPQPTGKTFVATNFSIAVAKTGKEVRFMDCTKHCGAKLWFNAPQFPFSLRDIPLSVSGYDMDGFKGDVVVIETDDKEHIPHDSKLIIVTDSDYAHQVLIAKELTSLSPVGMVWNQQSDESNPEKSFSLPVILTLPYYQDTNKRIKLGRPRAFDDPKLCERLISILNFDAIDHFMSGVLR